MIARFRRLAPACLMLIPAALAFADELKKEVTLESVLVRHIQGPDRGEPDQGEIYDRRCLVHHLPTLHGKLPAPGRYA